MQDLPAPLSNTRLPENKNAAQLHDLQQLNVHEVAEHFGDSMSGNDPVRLSFQDEKEGDFQLEMEAFNSVLIYNTSIKPGQGPFRIPLYREEPTLVLMFQGAGHAVFKKKNSFFEVASESHSMHFFPGFDSNFCTRKGQQAENMTIKLKLDYFEKFVLDNQHIGGWFYDEMQKNNMINSARKELSLSPEIKTILHQIKHCPYDDVLQELYVDGLIKMLLTHQLNMYNQLFLDKKPAWIDEKLNRQDVEKLRSLKTYLDQHYLKPLSMDDLTRQFILNEFKLKYGFKKLYGNSVMQYIYEKRLNHGKKLLIDTDKSITEIAYILGFEYSNNFSASFKNKFGYSPTEFRKKSPVAL